MRTRERGKEQKGKSKKDKPCIIYIITEGSTEEIYLNHYDNMRKGIEVIAVPSKYTDALGIVKFAKQYIDENDVDVQLGDKCYCVFDSDPQSNPDINQAFNLVRGYKHKGLECIFSNPCFEIWFVLHFRNAPYGKSAEDIKKLVKELVKDRFPEYKETVDIFDYLSDKQAIAMTRAKDLHRKQSEIFRDVFSHEANPYTNIFEFLEYIAIMGKSM